MLKAIPAQLYTELPDPMNEQKKNDNGVTV